MQCIICVNSNLIRSEEQHNGQNKIQHNADQQYEHDDDNEDTSSSNSCFGVCALKV
jgi:hypothetical protein